MNPLQDILIVMVGAFFIIMACFAFATLAAWYR